MPKSSSSRPQADGVPPAWVLSLAVAATVEVPGIEPQPRAAFLEWLWERLADCDLLGVCEGEVLAHEAAALGIVSDPLVIDAAAAPRERDWVAELPVVTAACWFGEESSARRASRRLEGLAGCGVLGLSAVACGRPDAWQDAFAPIEVPGFGWVRPAWEPGRAAAEAGGATLFIEPGIGFGTGLHPTTQLCLAAIATAFRSLRRCDRVVDFGSGSGILAVAAAVLGATRVHAIESDASVHDAIRSHAVRNSVADRVAVAPLLPAGAGFADLVVANIVAAVLLDHAEPLSGLVARDPTGRLTGCLVLSGLRATDVAVVAARFTELLGGSPRRTARDGWESLAWWSPGGPPD
jgi:ribosomal protein L11 methyltransferase